MANGKKAIAFIDTNIWIRVLSQARPGCELEHLEALEKLMRASSLTLVVPEVVELEIKKQWRSFRDDITREIGSIEKLFSDAMSKKKMWNEIDDVQKKVAALLSAEKKSKVSDATKLYERIQGLLCGAGIAKVPLTMELAFLAKKRTMAGGMPGQNEKADHLVHNDACIVESLKQYLSQKAKAAPKFYFCSENVEDFGLNTSGDTILHPLLQDDLPQTKFTATLRDLVDAVLTHAAVLQPSQDAVEKALEERVLLRRFLDQDRVFRRHRERETGYRDDFQDFGPTTKEFELDWRRQFKTTPPADVIERARAIRAEIYEQATCPSCGNRPEWLTDETIATLKQQVRCSPCST